MVNRQGGAGPERTVDAEDSADTRDASVPSRGVRLCLSAGERLADLY